jgi:hypothetical protein
MHPLPFDKFWWKLVTLGWAIATWLCSVPICIAAPPRPTHESARLRGPVHEAFASPLAGTELPGTVVNRHPAPPLVELPAAIKPISPRAIWIPGYWGWEPAEEEFLWVPGVWRVPPPGMRWVPGYWDEHGGGVRWVRGFWYSVKESRFRYLPSPPERPRESGRQLAADQYQVPGHWSFFEGQYRWNKGFVSWHKSGWVWMPSHHVWTPRGSVFVPGYWDYAMMARGVALAPAHVATEVPGLSGRAVAFAPKIAVNVAELPEALFIDADQGHYLFGDYFEPRFADQLTPWFEADKTWGADPNFAYESWRQSATPDWPHTLAERYRHRRDEVSMRPPLTFAERARGDTRNPDEVPDMGFSVSALARSRSAARSAVELAPDAVRRASQNAVAVASLAAQRAKFEQGSPATGDQTVAFYLPVPVQPLDRTRATTQTPSATAGQYVPGVAGRTVPGAVGRSLPGMSGRTVPGVDIRVPGVIAPGVVPGADTGLERP